MRQVYILVAALVVALIAFLGIKLAKLISSEGFETMKNFNDLIALESDKISVICPNNGVLIGRVTVPNLNQETAKAYLSKAVTDPLSILTGGITEIAWACYPPGVTNVNSIFQSDPAISPSGVMIFGPKGSTIDLYSEKDAKGKLVKSVNDYTSLLVKGCPQDTICSDSINFRDLQFASVKITAPPQVTPSSNFSFPEITFSAQTCPTLSPAAAAAAAAADAKEKENAIKAAAIADATSEAISKSIMKSMSDTDSLGGSSIGSNTLGSDSDGNMVSVTCPLGDKPKISFVRNTRNAIPGSVDVNTLSGVTGSNPSSSRCCKKSSPAPAIGNGTGGGYYFDPEKEY
jgi:hypothetical protein